MSAQENEKTKRKQLKSTGMEVKSNESEWGELSWSGIKKNAGGIWKWWSIRIEKNRNKIYSTGSESGWVIKSNRPFVVH